MPIQLRYLDVKLRKISLFKAPGHLLTDVSLSPCWKTHLAKSIKFFPIGILCDLPWQWHVEWSLHWLSLLVTSCGGSLGPHQPYKGCVKKENCMVLCSHSDCGWEVEASLNLTLPPLQPRMGVLAFMVIWSKSSNSVKRWKTARDELNRLKGKVWGTVTSKWRLHLTPFSQFWYGWGAGHIFSPVKSFWNRLHEVSLSFPLVLLCTVCWSHSEVHCSLPHRLCLRRAKL